MSVVRICSTRIWLIVLLCTAILSAGACAFSSTNESGNEDNESRQEASAGSGGSTPTSDEIAGDLVVFAAASLTESFTQIHAELESTYPELELTLNFAGSQQLATQLQQGAQADVFASANPMQMQVAEDAGVIADEPRIFARNRLIIIVPISNQAGINEPGDLSSEGLKLVLGNEDVPVGVYTRQIFDNLSSDDWYGTDFRSRVEENIVSLESDVKQVASKVQLGEADAGIVYATDVTREVAEDVTIIEIPEEVNVVGTYPVASVEGSNRANAEAFIQFLLSDDGQDILQKYGFISPAE